LFIPDGHTVTFAEISADEKNAISHRGRAVQALVGVLK
jgi:XTP/dITP diphosphohydrolase